MRQALSRLTEWVANGLVPFAAIRALMSNRLVALDKCPGVRPIGVGQIWRRAIAKCVIAVVSDAAADACGTDQLCAGLSCGSEAAVHAAHMAWDAHASEPDWGFLKIDATNAFNEQDRTMALWVARHEWPHGACFLFNCYRHYALLVIRSPDGHAFIFYSRIGYTSIHPRCLAAKAALTLQYRSSYLPPSY